MGTKNKEREIVTNDRGENKSNEEDPKPGTLAYREMMERREKIKNIRECREYGYYLRR